MLLLSQDSKTTGVVLSVKQQRRGHCSGSPNDNLGKEKRNAKLVPKQATSVMRTFQRRPGPGFDNHGWTDDDGGREDGGAMSTVVTHNNENYGTQNRY